MVKAEFAGTLNIDAMRSVVLRFCLFKTFLRVSQCKTCVSREISTVLYHIWRYKQQETAVVAKGQDVAFTKNSFSFFFLYLKSYGLVQNKFAPPGVHCYNLSVLLLL